MEFYWELIQFDGERIEIAPQYVEQIKRKMANNEPIQTTTAMIPANQVKKFQVTDKMFTSQPLLEAAAQAFKEPVITEKNGEELIESRWVKKTVTKDRWGRYYSQSPGYKFLNDDSGMAVIAFRLAIHDIDSGKTPYCTEDEVRVLTKE